jgi:Peptidase family M1 domain
MKQIAVVAAFAAALTCLGSAGPLGRRPAAAAAAGQNDPDDVKIRALLQRLEQIARRSDTAAFLDLLTGSADSKGANDFASSEFRAGAARVVIQERDRQNLPGTLPGNGYTLTLDAFMEYGDRARVATWQLDLKRIDDDWRIAGPQMISAVENLYRLSVNTQKQYDAHNFTVLSEDLELTLVDGTVFVVETNQGVTGLVLLGHGEMNFHPSPETEKGQVRIFAGTETLESRFDTAFVRLGTYETHADPSLLKARAVDPRDLKRAEQVFREDSPKSYVVDLADLTRDTWSILPGDDDFLAEIRTRKYEALTYARSAGEAEDISFFERRRHRNIAVYASKGKLQTRGRFYNEDDLAPFDVIDYDIDVAATPDRQWIDGRAVMRLRVRAPSVGQLTIRLADSLVVRSVLSDQFGRLFSLRVMNQNLILVNLPATVLQDTEMTITIEYSGRLEPQAPERETVLLGQRDQAFPPPEADDPFTSRPEPTFLYSNMSYWYPQSTVTDYATGTIQITVPAAYGCIATGEQRSDSPQTIQPAAAGGQPRKVYAFSASRPLRYFSFLVAKLNRADRWTVVFDNDAPLDAVKKPATAVVDAEPYKKLDLIVEAHPRQANRGKGVAERAVDVVQYYESLIGDSPYSAFTVAVIESALPGGHSPGYFAVLNQPSPMSGVSWRNDPASFATYPEFFLAHEVAHQWWGQAVGWRNYHEQWLSEGFAQYFAALYAQKFRGEDVFNSVIRQMRRWAINESDQGPVYLGYRVGHVKNEGRAFRAVIYNKGAMVLHMLRRLLGDDVFFKGMRRFYVDSRFTKAGTENFREAMETASGRSLERFFERWIYNSTLPRVSFSYRIETTSGPGGPNGSSGQSAVLRIEQAGDIFDFPLTVTLQYTDRKPMDLTIPVTDKLVEVRVPLEGTLRGIDATHDDGTLAEVSVTR